MNENDWVTIAEVESLQADIFKGILESHGLTVFVENANTSNMLPHLAMTNPAQVQVPSDQVEKAQQILADMEDEEEDMEEIPEGPYYNDREDDDDYEGDDEDYDYDDEDDDEDYEDEDDDEDDEEDDDYDYDDDDYEEWN